MTPAQEVKNFYCQLTDNGVNKIIAKQKTLTFIEEKLDGCLGVQTGNYRGWVELMELKNKFKTL